MICNYTMSVVEFVWVAWQDLVFLKSCLPLEVFQSEWCSVSFLSLPVQVPFHHSSLCMRFCWNSFFLFFRNQQLCFVFFKLSYTRATFEVRKLHLQGWWHVQCKFYWMWHGGRINSKTRENTNTKKPWLAIHMISLSHTGVLLLFCYWQLWETKQITLQKCINCKYINK